MRKDYRQRETNFIAADSEVDAQLHQVSNHTTNWSIVTLKSILIEKVRNYSRQQSLFQHIYLKDKKN